MKICAQCGKQKRYRDDLTSCPIHNVLLWWSPSRARATRELASLIEETPVSVNAAPKSRLPTKRDINALVNPRPDDRFRNLGFLPLYVGLTAAVSVGLVTAFFWFSPYAWIRKLRSLETRIESLETSNRGYASQLEGRNRDLAAIRYRMELSERDAGRLRAENREIAGRLSQAMENSRELRAKLAASENKIRETNESLSQMQPQAKLVQAENDKQRSQLDNLREQNRQLEANTALLRQLQHAMPQMEDLLSRSLSKYLQMQRLPYVNAEVTLDERKGLTITLHGSVKTSSGKDDAADKARGFFDDQRLPVVNEIQIDPGL
jgi:hypothetical protein